MKSNNVICCYTVLKLKTNELASKVTYNFIYKHTSHQKVVSKLTIRKP